MQHDPNGLNHHIINESFYSEHSKQDGPVRIFNKLHYLMGEYSLKTGVATWQRVIPSPQRMPLERWLSTHYPVAITV